MWMGIDLRRKMKFRSDCLGEEQENLIGLVWLLIMSDANDELVGTRNDTMDFLSFLFKYVWDEHIHRIGQQVHRVSRQR
jgi:hypothetical protein